MSDFKYYPLTHPQKSIWYTEKMFPNTSISNVAGTARIKGTVDIDLFEKAINLLIKKNDAFRIRITNINGEEMQYINAYQYRKIDFLDFSEYEYPDKQMYNWNEEQTSIPFNLYDSDLCYFAIIKISNEEFAFYAKTHHIISDAWTMSLLVNEVLAFYSALKRGEEINQDNFPSYIEYINSEIEYKNSERFIKDQQYWIDKFDPLPEATVLKTPTSSEKRTESKRRTIITPIKFTNKLREYCKENNTSPYPLFLSALAMYINRVTEKEDIVIGTPILNRSNRREKNITGMFINTLPLRLFIDPNTSFKSFSKYVSAESMSLLRHQKYPYDLLLKNIRSKYNYSETLYDIILSYQNSKMEKNVTDDKYSTRWHFNQHQVNSLTIHINDRDDDGQLIIDYDYHENLYSVKEINSLHTQFLSLLWHALDNPEKNINKIEMLPESEKNKILYEFNSTKADYPKDKTIHQLFEEQVERTPDSVALVFEGKTMTYRELNQKANKLAYALRDKGVQPDDIIALMMERSFDVVVGMLGILKAGCAFLPIDPSYPDERIKFMLEDSNIRIVLTQAPLTNKVDKEFDTLEIDNLKENYEYVQNPKHINKPTDLAYVIYTSGSTGKPKGAMIEHRNIVNFTYGVKDIMGFSAGVSVLSMTTISFDIFIFEILPSLILGLRIVLASKEQQMSPAYILKLISQYSIEILHGTPSRIQSLIDDKTHISCVNNLKSIIIGGEVFSYKLLETLKKLTNAKIYNGYGPTETTIGVTFKDLTNTSKINIGRPINNISIYILDKHMNLVPIGVPGYIYIGGDGVGRGYVNRPQETNTKFIPNPFVPGEKLYYSGDMGRWYPRGEIEFLGRMDNQVKINGLRIELDEIENQLLKIDDIQKVVVVVRENKNKSKLLCAYYVADEEIPSHDISKQLSKHLPEYMIPAVYIRVESIPTTLSGKVDIKRLPEIDFDKVAAKNYVAPENYVQEKLVELWKEILNIQSIGIDNSFFELGGDSLAAIKLQVKLLEFNWNFKIQDIYKYNTIRALSEKIMSTDTEECPLYLEKITRSSETEKNDNAVSDIHIENTSYNNILLFGATGFLGIHILEYLLNHTNSKIFCIIRSETLTETENRFMKLLSHYFPDKFADTLERRVFILKGDITKKYFGLSDDKYQQIIKNTDAVIHTAALVKYYADYSEFESVNVFGTKNIAEFAFNNNLPLFYISTMGLAGHNYTKNTKQNYIFSENVLYNKQAYEHNMYLKSKYEAEKIINQYIIKGLKAAIFRVGNLTGRYSDGHFQINIQENYFYNILKTILSIGAVSDNILDSEFDLTPVDLCSKAIIEIVLTKNCLGKNFHIYNHNRITVNELLNLLDLINIHIKTLNKEDFQSLIKKLSMSGNEELDGIANDLNDEYQLDFGSNVYLDSSFSIDYLKKLDFHWPVIDEKYIQKLIKYMKAVKFID